MKLNKHDIFYETFIRNFLRHPDFTQAEWIQLLIAMQIQSNRQLVAKLMRIEFTSQNLMKDSYDGKYDLIQAVHKPHVTNAMRKIFLQTHQDFEILKNKFWFWPSMRLATIIAALFIATALLSGCGGSNSSPKDSNNISDLPAWYFSIHPSTNDYRALVASHSPLGTCTYGAMGPLIEVFYNAHPYNLAADDIWIMGENCLIETVDCGTYAYVTDFIDGISADVIKMTVIGHQNPSAGCLYLGDYVCSMFSRGSDYRVECSYRAAKERFIP